MSSARSDIMTAQRHDECWRPAGATAPYPPERDFCAIRSALTCLVLAGLGVMAWRYLGPDFRRYMKIERR